MREPETEKRCRRCNKTKPAADFYPAQHVRQDGTRGLHSWCVACCRHAGERQRDRRRGGPPTRKATRTNAHGDIWCAHCQAYGVPDDFAFPPSLHGKPDPYCRACLKALRKMTYRSIMATPERRQRWQARQRINSKRRWDGIRRNRGHFVRDAISLLQRRDFTRSDVAYVLDVNYLTLATWVRGEVIAVPNAANRSSPARRRAIGRRWRRRPTNAKPSRRGSSPWPTGSSRAGRRCRFAIRGKTAAG